jgi:hypothetical protein
MFNDVHPAGSIAGHASHLRNGKMASWFLAFANLVLDEGIEALAQ